MTASPCLTCWSLADCGTCLPRLRWEGAQVAEQECLTCVDIAHLRNYGGYRTRTQIAERLRISHSTYAAHERHYQEAPA